MRIAMVGFIALVALTGLFAATATAGSISGSVIDANASPVREVLTVGISSDGWEWVTQEIDNGAYSFNDVPMGVYLVQVTPMADDTWFYQVFYPGVWHRDEAQWVFVPDQGEVADANVTLYYGGKVSGAATPAEGGAFAANSVRATLLQPSDSFFDAVGTEMLEDPSDYTSPVIPAGEYTVRIVPLPMDMHVPTFYGDTYNMFEAGIFTVNEREETANINIALPLGGGISGHITADGEAAACAAAGYSAGMGAFTFALPLAYGFTDQNGDYIMRGLPVGDAYVSFIPDDETFVQQWYDGVYDPLEADVVQISAGEVTTDINAALERGATVAGTVRLPDGSAPQPFGVEVSAVDKYGQERLLNLEWDEIGGYRTATPLSPGLWTFKFFGITDVMSVGGYLGGEPHAWNAPWIYLEPNTNAGPYDFDLTWGGVVSGQITDADGNPAVGADVFLYRSGAEFQSSSADGNGNFYFPYIPVGEYVLAAQANATEGINESQLWPFICTGGAFNLDEAETFEVTPRDTTFADLHFVAGGVLHVIVTNPDGGYYDFYRDDVAAVPVPVTNDGKVIFFAPSYPNQEGAPNNGEEGLWYILAPGTYTLVGVPVFTDFNPNVETPNLRRTFAGGGFGRGGAQTVQVRAGQIAELSVQMVEDGYSITGSAATESGDAAPAMAVLVDANGFVAGVYLTFIGDGIPLRENNFEIKGAPNGSYRLMAQINQEAYFLSTWYPDVATPGMVIENMHAPQGAEAVNVAGADVGDVNIIVQTAGDVRSVPTEEPAVASGYALEEIYPNPFNGFARITFALPGAGQVRVKLFDLTGREVSLVAEGRFAAGTNHLAINAGSLPAGVYLVKAEANGWSAVRKAVLVK